jgi:hypothetical protein
MIFGRQGPPRLTKPPKGVVWREIRAKQQGESVAARLAEENGVISSPRGQLRFRAGRDYIVSRPDEQSVVSVKVFERTYQARPDGRFEKRTDVIYKYFTLPVPVNVATQEGPQIAAAGDWIVQGLDGELWPVKPERAGAIYEHV